MSREYNNQYHSPFHKLMLNTMSENKAGLHELVQLNSFFPVTHSILIQVICIQMSLKCNTLKLFCKNCVPQLANYLICCCNFDYNVLRDCYKQIWSGLILLILPGIKSLAVGSSFNIYFLIVYQLQRKETTIKIYHNYISIDVGHKKYMKPTQPSMMLSTYGNGK